MVLAFVHDGTEDVHRPAATDGGPSADGDDEWLPSEEDDESDAGVFVGDISWTFGEHLEGVEWLVGVSGGDVSSHFVVCVVVVEV